MNRPAATRIVALGIGLIGAILVGELLLRGTAQWMGQWGVRLVTWDPFATKIIPMGEHGYRPRPGSILKYANGAIAFTNGQGTRGDTVVMPKPVGRVRIVLLGGSTTHGYGVNDRETIGAAMTRLADSAFGPGRIDVVNLAYDGYDSYQERERLVADGLRLDPDIIVVNTGINDVRNARQEHLEIPGPDPRTILYRPDTERLKLERANGGPSMATYLKHWLFLARLPGVIRSGLADVAPGRRTTPVTGYPDALDYFEHNERSIDSVAASVGAPILFSVSPSALLLRDPPSATSSPSYWLADAAATQAYRNRIADRLGLVVTSRQAAGRSVKLIRPTLPADVFLDDCHLTAAGNLILARRFLDEVAPWINPHYPSESP